MGTASNFEVFQARTCEQMCILFEIIQKGEGREQRGLQKGGWDKKMLFVLVVVQNLETRASAPAVLKRTALFAESDNWGNRYETV